ncbi:MAG: hypothetical protein JO022_07640, partial [Acidobacteriaceae bacterium]|nr:hypothetical protein [Acidobacteriaceae bacterium]
ALEVRVDPTSNTSPAELKAEFDYGLKLRDLQSASNDALRALDGIREQLNTASKTVGTFSPQASKDLLNALKERLQQIASIEDKLVRPGNIPGYSMGPRLVDRLTALASGMENTLTAPTGPQRELYQQLMGEFNHEIDRVNTLLTKGVPEINDLLRKHNAGAIMSAKPIAAPAGVER